MGAMTKARSAAAAVIAALGICCATAGGAIAAPGDLYVADRSAGVGGQAFRVDLATGTATVVYTAPNANDQVADVAFAPDGRLLVLDLDHPGAPGYPGALFGIDPLTGAPSTIVGGPPFQSPSDLVVEGNVAWIADEDLYGTTDAADGGVLRVDLRTGALQEIPLSRPMEETVAIAVGPGGTKYVADQYSEPNGMVFRLDAAGGLTPIYTAPDFVGPVDLAAAPDGSLLVLLSGDTESIVRLDPSTGAASQVYGGAALEGAESIALGADGLIYVSDGNAFGTDPGVVRIDPGGVASPVLLGAPLDSPDGLISEPPHCAGLTATIVGSNGDDQLVGGPEDDVIASLGGKDRVIGAAGNDVICGGTGKDVLKGGKGRDRLFGEAGKDRLLGGKGKKDRCIGGKGRDSGSCERGKL